MRLLSQLTSSRKAAAMAAGHTVSPEAKAGCELALQQLVDAIPAVVSAGIVGPDGFEIAVVTRVRLEVSKIAALSSTLIAVADAFAAESGMKSCRNLILESESGATFLFSVPWRDAVFALFVTASDEAMLGKVLWRGRQCATQIGGVLAG